MHHLERWEQLGAAILGRKQLPHAGGVDNYRPDDWVRLSRSLEEHRGIPIALSLLSDEQRSAMPPALLERWKDAHITYTLQHLRQQQVLADCYAAFDKLGVDALALKGAWLSICGYAEPGLRPMRDLDLLVRGKENAVLVFDHLRSNGYRTLKPFQKHDWWLENSHQLPALVDPSESVLVEVHHRVFHGNGPDMSDEDRFWASAFKHKVIGQEVVFPGLEWTAVHILAHSFRDHKLNNGPLVVTDLSILFGHEDFQLERYQELVEHYALEKEAMLAFGLLSRVESKANDAEINAAWTMMFSSNRELRALRDRERFTQYSWGELLGQVVPSPSRLTSQYGVPKGFLSKARGYASHFNRLLRQRSTEVGTKVEPRTAAACEIFENLMSD
ncbi:nucleotidyltransferase family protein [Sphingomicrobium aestuariivivum]|uniref:nucleotidyltransferase family protein n=1 Tax=Sphingomicrobium aestuariivivum TaxID=1582356 RepID=UPI001FD6BAB7|nr:nucleotidyltransferase family protein [Sphingomicrobium aestuariivivum]MCJ8192030.1 nucleotidyltransferase family protein [Sphingomicrobium aestuariivivum]